MKNRSEGSGDQEGLHLLYVSAGDPGLEGPTGDFGVPGPKGVRGDQGLTGPPGNMSDVDMEHMKGEKGDLGFTGRINQG